MVDDVPDAVGRGRHVDMAHAKRLERIEPVVDRALELRAAELEGKLKEYFLGSSD